VRIQSYANEISVITKKNTKKNMDKTRKELVKAVKAVKENNKGKINELLYLYDEYLLEFESL
jgi:hypothetical protein